ncbi:hypothetical protein BDV34DRAFT_63437 [Aspergillus parasiticus]|uniref:Uncharacterized protein n=1 Tax=Aspergillus parasiticus TaxID=5067 RepID=A0A5N6E4J3_ASPPA|nr:hypothetical protein BDV34DRAFT_63437 [Aspergillus parasiticus]
MASVGAKELAMATGQSKVAYRPHAWVLLLVPMLMHNPHLINQANVSVRSRCQTKAVSWERMKPHDLKHPNNAERSPNEGKSVLYLSPHLEVPYKSCSGLAALVHISKYKLRYNKK